MFFLPKIRERLMASRLNDEVEFYKTITDAQISQYHLNEFGKIWAELQQNIPYYKKLVEQELVPSTITSWDEFQKIPIKDRSYVKENIKYFSDSSRKPDKFVTTGGSTGTPLKYPSWKEEAHNYESNIWFARDFYKIRRSDRMFRLWGHSHTLGSGLTKYKKQFAFFVGHPLIGYKRFSAYDLSNEKLKEAGQSIIKFKPSYIIGYSKALYMLAKANEDKKNKFHKLHLKAVIGGAEGFDKKEDEDFVSEVFGTKVGLEYASMETKLLAHTHPDGGYRVLWRNNIVECVDEHGNPAQSGRVLVTSLYPRAFPLVRYELGDLIVNTNKVEHSVISFENVRGRDNDFLMLDKNTPIHSEAITHAIKFSDKIESYQIRYTTDFRYTIYIKSSDIITNKEKEDIASRLKQIDERLYKIPIVQTEVLKQTVAGKTKWLIKE